MGRRPSAGAPACKRLLLLIPSTTYRTEDFVEAARTLDIDLVIASDRPNVMRGEFPDSLLTLPFANTAAAVQTMREYAGSRPLDAVVPVDDVTTVVGAAIAGALGLRANPVPAVQATRNKLVMRERLAEAGVSSPAFLSVALGEDPAAAASRMSYPCVLKPLVLSASRGVIRANDPDEFVTAFERIRAILAAPDVRELGEGLDRILIEQYVPGAEVALEGLLRDGVLETLALGLVDGPVHAELRLAPALDQPRPVMLELAARSIGGLCSRTLRFGTGMSLEEVILRHALGWPIASLERERRAAAVMMIPIPAGGLLEEVQGLDEARAVPLIEDVTISMHKGQEVVPLPEGSRYLGFIFSRATTPAEAESAVREAHRGLRFVIR